MGWTFYDAHFYDSRGRVDRKAECNRLLTWEDETSKHTVLKAVMKGRVHYSAVEVIIKATGERHVDGSVILTSSDIRGNGFNFGYKGISENMGPCEQDCPLSILNLLTPTESKWANDWRDACRKRAEMRKASPKLASLPVGTVIAVTCGSTIYKVKKMAPAYQFKRPWYAILGTNHYLPVKDIITWKIISDNQLQ